MQRVRRIRALSAGLAAIVTVGLLSCSDKRPTPEAPEDVIDEIPLSFRVLVAQPDEHEANVGDVINVTAYLYRPDGEPAVGEEISFDLLDEEGAEEGGNPGGAVLEARSVQTDEEGLAEVPFHVGNEGDVSLTIMVSNQHAIERHIVVHVDNLPVGTIKATVDYDGPVQVGPIDLFVMAGENRCPYNAIRVPLGQVAQSTVNAAGQSAEFGPFLSGQTYTIFARGIIQVDGMRTLGAQGCLDGILIPEAAAAEVSIQMLLIPMNPVGSFDVQNHFDFVDAIPGTIGTILQNLDDLFNDTGNYLIDRIQNGVELFAESVLGLIGSILSRAINWVIDQFQPFLANAINDWLANSAPDWLRDFFTVGQDLLQIVTNLEVISLMTFDKVASDFRLAGETTWAGLALYWRLDCEPDAPPDCGRHEFRIEELLDTEYPLEIIWARFTARVVPYNGLKIDRHDVNLQYGRLILFVLNEMILPRIADGARSLSEALVNAFNCESLAWSITGDNGVLGFRLPGWAGGRRIGISQAQIQGWCEGAAGFIGGLAADWLEGLAADSRLSLEGECKMFEDTQDLLVDRLESGTWSGTIRVGGDEGPRFSGDFRGCRRVGRIDAEAPFTDRCPVVPAL